MSHGFSYQLRGALQRVAEQTGNEATFALITTVAVVVVVAIVYLINLHSSKGFRDMSVTSAFPGSDVGVWCPQNRCGVSDFYYAIFQTVYIPFSCLPFASPRSCGRFIGTVLH